MFRRSLTVVAGIVTMYSSSCLARERGIEPPLEHGDLPELRCEPGIKAGPAEVLSDAYLRAAGIRILNADKILLAQKLRLKCGGSVTSVQFGGVTVNSRYLYSVEESGPVFAEKRELVGYDGSVDCPAVKPQYGIRLLVCYARAGQRGSYFALGQKRGSEVIAIVEGGGVVRPIVSVMGNDKVSGFAVLPAVEGGAFNYSFFVKVKASLGFFITAGS